jgi:hypothetical protein
MSGKRTTALEKAGLAILPAPAIVSCRPRRQAPGTLTLRVAPREQTPFVINQAGVTMARHSGH